uniref:Uncharacterized protein n=1 Tax=Panagrolaimus superbus TaxID=310955 RepID=A0A914YIU6_9BILA
MDDENESDATRFFNVKSSREFSREFLGKRSQKDVDQERKIRHLTLLLAEAEANIIDKQKFVELAKIEAKELHGREKDAYEKYEKTVREVEALKVEISRLRLIERDYNDKKVSGDFILQSYRSALSKYKSWHEYATKQLETMKIMLEGCGKWDRDNRYKIYFSYKSLPPTIVTDDQATELAMGSVVDYKGIDDVESIMDERDVAKYLNNSTQTEENDSSSGIDYSSFNSTRSLGRLGNNNGSLLHGSVIENPFQESYHGSHLSSIKMSGSELQYLDLKERMKKMELENIQLKDQLYLARDGAKKASELKEQNRGLINEVSFLKQKIQTIYDEKEKLAENIQNKLFADLVGPSRRAESREIIEKVMTEKERNDTLLRKNVELEEEIRRLSAASQFQNVGSSQSSQPSNQTVEESVVYRHMKENPFQQAVKEHEERENLKRRRLDDGGYDLVQSMEQLEEIKKLKNEIEKLNAQSDRARAFQNEFARRYRESVRNITGYDIKMRNEEFIDVSNVYDLGNHFSFQREGKEINLLDSEYAKSWQQFMEKYLHEYDSLACFMSAVTIDLRSRQLQQQTTDSRFA